MKSEKIRIFSALLLGIFLMSSFAQINSLNNKNKIIIQQTDIKINPKEQAGLIQWGKFGGKEGDLNKPTAITISDKDLLYVCDTQNHRINVYDTNGQYKFGWGSYGIETGEFDTPQGIAFDGQNNYIYVSDTKNKRVQIFDASSGQYLTDFSIMGEPGGIAIDTNGSVYVTDLTYNQVIKYSSEGAEEITSWGSSLLIPGSADGEFDKPSCIAINQSNYIYVVDSHNTRIQIFNSNGDFISKFGTQGLNSGQFQKPSSIYISSNNLVYVTDFWGHNVQVFDMVGNFLYTWGSEGSSMGSLKNPTGVVLDIYGYVYILEYGNNRIQKFYPESQFKTYPGDIVVDENDDFYYLDSNLATIFLYDISSKTPILKFGERGVDDGKFTSPVTIEMNDYGLYVLDSANGKISRFNDEGIYISSFGTENYDNIKLINPLDFAISESNNFYIADSGNNRIVILDSVGSFIDSFGSYGRDDGEFIRPIAIEVSDSFIYVLDETGRLQEFDLEGNFASKWGSVGTGASQFGFPTKLKVYDTNIYVVNTFSNRIQKYNLGGVHSNTWGVLGDELGEMNFPSGIDFFSDGNLIVADTGNYRFQIFTATGVVQSEFYSGSSMSNLRMMPYGVAYANSTNELYVTDWLCDCIRVFDIDGILIRTIGTSGSGDNQFKRPRGITFDYRTNNIFVVDSGNNRIVVLNNDVQIKSTDYSIGGGFSSISDIAVNSTGAIYVSDSSTNRIIVFNSTLDFQFIISGIFDTPKGLYIDEEDNLLVVDSGNHRILYLDGRGAYLGSLGTGYGADEGELSNPCDIIKNLQNEYVITDSDNNRIDFFNQTRDFVDSYGRFGNSLGRFQSPTQVEYINENMLVVSDWGNGRLQFIDRTNMGKFSAPILNSVESPDEDGNFTLSWNSVIDAEYYLVYRSTTEVVSDELIRYLEPIAILSNTSYSESNLLNGTYYYAVAAGNAQENSSVSNSIEVIVAIPGIPVEKKIGTPTGLPFLMAIMIGIIFISRKTKKVKYM